ncbi:MAG: GatB/YqeY domain-containing protein [Patescibacteria group bacterium]
MLARIQNDIKDALRRKDAERLSVLRMLAASLQSRQIEKRAKIADQFVALTDEEVMAVLKQEAKKRQDSVQQFISAGRVELAEKESKEFLIIQAYLPAELSDGELSALVQKIVSTMGTVQSSDFGKIMGAIMKETKGLASGDRVSALVKNFLRI